MATDDEYKVTKALFDHLSSLTTVPATEIAWPNVNFEPSTYPYLRVNVIPTRPGRTTESGDMKRHVGIFQVSVMARKGAGEMAARKIAGQVIDRFKQSTTLFTTGNSQCVQITEPPHEGGAIEGDSEIMLPVQIYYSSFSTVS